VADDGNYRVQVFDLNEGYLTTLDGGTWGGQPGLFRNAEGVAVDRGGSVFIADWANDRVQRYAFGMPVWWQTNLSGFGDRLSAGIWSLAAPLASSGASSVRSTRLGAVR
jgi:hypothetical protein